MYIPCLLQITTLHFCGERKIRYSQTCSKDHLYRTTTCLRWPMLSLPKRIPIQLLMYKTTICLTWPVTTFFVFRNEKKNLSKTTTKLKQAKTWETDIRQQCIKNKCLSDYIYATATLQCKVCLMSIKITHMWRRWGTPPNFFMAVIVELGKHIII